MSDLQDDLRKRAKAIAHEANECCNRSDGYEEAIEDLALQHLAHLGAEIARLLRCIDSIEDELLRDPPRVDDALFVCEAAKAGAESSSG